MPQMLGEGTRLQSSTAACSALLCVNANVQNPHRALLHTSAGPRTRFSPDTLLRCSSQESSSSRAKVLTLSTLRWIPAPCSWCWVFLVSFDKQAAPRGWAEAWSRGRRVIPEVPAGREVLAQMPCQHMELLLFLPVTWVPLLWENHRAKTPDSLNNCYLILYSIKLTVPNANIPLNFVFL